MDQPGCTKQLIAMIKRLALACVLLGITGSLSAQDLIGQIGTDAADAKKDYVSATFKSTRLINLATSETVGPKTLDFRISHRFGPVNSGAYNAWGIDGPANIRLGLDYSYDGRLMLGIGRSSLDKMVDGSIKYRLLRQTVENGMPVNLTLFAGAYRNGVKTSGGKGVDPYFYGWDRFSYVFQAILSRKFSPDFSLQMTPFFVHYNLVEHITDKNDMYGVAFCTRYKFTKRSAITVEYAWRFPNDYALKDKYYNSFGIGYELETGGHVFQVHLTNSFGIADNQFLAHTTDSWNDGGIRLGFNISRVFTIPAGGSKSDW
jgi:hypothetical protein